MIIHLAAAGGSLQVGVTSRRPAAAPARDVGLTGVAAASAKLAEAAQGHDDCSENGKDDDSKHDDGWTDAKNNDCQSKNYCVPKPSDDCGKGDAYRNPGEALAKFDFSRW